MISLEFIACNGLDPKCGLRSALGPGFLIVIGNCDRCVEILIVLITTRSAIAGKYATYYTVRKRCSIGCFIDSSTSLGASRP